MICKTCGYKTLQNFHICPSCGAEEVILQNKNNLVTRQKQNYDSNIDMN